MPLKSSSNTLPKIRRKLVLTKLGSSQNKFNNTGAYGTCIQNEEGTQLLCRHQPPHGVAGDPQLSRHESMLDPKSELENAIQVSIPLNKAKWKCKRSETALIQRKAN